MNALAVNLQLVVGSYDHIIILNIWAISRWARWTCGMGGVGAVGWGGMVRGGVGWGCVG